MMEGQLNFLGSYDECLSIQTPDGFNGQYCAARWKPNPMNNAYYGRFGLCVPDLCSLTDVQHIVDLGELIIDFSLETDI